MDEAEDRHRKAIAAINRRRNRRYKPRANPRTKLTSWAEYGAFTFTPSGPGSFLGRLMWLVLGVLSAGSSIFVFFIGGTSEPPANLQAISPFWYVIFHVILAIIIFAALFSLFALSTALWRILRSNFGRL